MAKFHTGVSTTHVHQHHTKHTASRRHPLSDDGGLVGKHVQAEWQPAVERKQRQHQQQDMARMRVGQTRVAPPDEYSPWTSLGHAPSSSRQLHHHSQQGSA